MKIYLFIIGSLLSFGINGQVLYNRITVDEVKPFQLAISESKTTNLLFPYEIKRVHCASPQVSVQQMKDVKNILLVQASTVDFIPANLSVVTTDGNFYSFELQYASQPSALNMRLWNDSLSASRRFAHIDQNDFLLNNAASKIRQQKGFLRLIDREQLVKTTLEGIYMYQDLMWFKCTISNFSMINYPIDYIKFFVKDRVRSKKKIVQEREITPVYSSTPETVQGGASTSFVIAFEPFTLAAGKILEIQIGEKNGGRSLSIKAINNPFYKTRAIID